MRNSAAVNKADKARQCRSRTLQTTAARPSPDPTRIREDRAIYRALRIIEQRAREPGTLLSDPSAACAMFRLSLANEKREHFEAAFLDNKHRLIARERLFSGTIDGAPVYLRIVVQRALFHNAAAVIVAHNHPSGNAEPSSHDEAITGRLRDILNLVDVRLLDHIIVGNGKPWSIEAKRLV